MTNSTSAKQPSVLWAQRADRVLVSIQLVEVAEEKITVDGSNLKFSGKSSGEMYAVDLELNADIIPEESRQRKGGREYYFDLKKKDPGPYWPRLLKDDKKYQYIKIDFNRWKDEEDTDDEAGTGVYDDASLEDMMKQMGTGGGGAAGANFDPGDELDSEDSDDEDIPDLEAGTGAE